MGYSLGAAGFIGVRRGGHLVISVLLGCALWYIEFVRDRWVDWGAPSGSGSLGCSLVVIEFVRGRCVHCVGVVCFVRCNWVLWGTHREWLGSFGIARFIGVRPYGRRVRSVSPD